MNRKKDVASHSSHLEPGDLQSATSVAFMRELRHQIRTPINHIVGYCDLLMEEAEDRDLGQWLSTLHRIRGAGDQLLKTFDDTNAVERIVGVASDGHSLRQEVSTSLAFIISSAGSIHDDAKLAQRDDVASDMQRIRVAGDQLHILIDSSFQPLAVGDPASAGECTKAMVDVDDHQDRAAAIASISMPSATVLVVDDNEGNRDLLTRRLHRLGHIVQLAENGHDAIQQLEKHPIDLVLLDILMPGLTGYDVLEHLKGDPVLRHIPVIVLSAINNLESVVRCIEMGADDYLPKPFPPALLRARIGACLERKHLRDQEAMYQRQIELERNRVNELLHVILPGQVIDELKRTGSVQPRRHENVAVLFCDIVGFTEYCDKCEAQTVVSDLQQLIEAYEELALRFGIQKIKTIGDAFMAVAGLLAPDRNPALTCIEAGIEMISEAGNISPGWNVRVGVHVGPVVAGVLGKRQYLFDLWGDTVNMAARVESHSLPGCVAISRVARDQVGERCEVASLGVVHMKGKGDQEIFRVIRMSAL